MRVNWIQDFDYGSSELLHDLTSQSKIVFFFIDNVILIYFLNLKTVVLFR